MDCASVCPMILHKIMTRWCVHHPVYVLGFLAPATSCVSPCDPDGTSRCASCGPRCDSLRLLHQLPRSVVDIGHPDAHVHTLRRFNASISCQIRMQALAPSLQITSVCSPYKGECALSYAYQTKHRIDPLTESWRIQYRLCTLIA